MTELNEDDSRLVAEALVNAREWFLEFEPNPKGAQIVFRAIEIVAEIDKRMVTGKIGPRHYKSPWLVYLRSEEEAYEDLKQRMADLAAGDSFEEVFGYKGVTPRQIEMAAKVCRIFPTFMLGKNIVRDWKMIYKLAEGKKSLADVGRSYHMSRQAVHEKKGLQCTAIWSGVKHLVPEVPTGNILRSAA